MTPEEIKEKAEQFAGNWKGFEDFCWHEKPEENPEEWMLFYTHNRDSGLVEQSNAAAIQEILKPYIDIGYVVPESHSHWAVGHVDGYSVRVYRHGCITPAFKALCHIVEQMEDYAVLDEDDLHEREYEAALQGIESSACSLAQEAPKNWASMLYRWLWDHEPSELDDCDGQGAYPSTEACERGLLWLGLLDPEEDWSGRFSRCSCGEATVRNPSKDSKQGFFAWECPFCGKLTFTDGREPFMSQDKVSNYLKERRGRHEQKNSVAC